MVKGSTQRDRTQIELRKSQTRNLNIIIKDTERDYPNKYSTISCSLCSILSRN